MADQLSADNASTQHSHSGHGQHKHHGHKGDDAKAAENWTGDSESQMLRLLFNTHGPDTTHDSLSLKKMDDMLSDLGIPEGKRDHVEEHLLKKGQVRGEVTFKELAHYWKDHGHKDDVKALGKGDKRNSLLHFFESVRHFSQKQKVAVFSADNIAQFLITFGFGEKEASEQTKAIVTALGWKATDSHSYAEFCTAMVQQRPLIAQLQKHVPEEQHQQTT